MSGNGENMHELPGYLELAILTDETACTAQHERCGGTQCPKGVQDRRFGCIHRLDHVQGLEGLPATPPSDVPFSEALSKARTAYEGLLKADLPYIEEVTPYHAFIDALRAQGLLSPQEATQFKDQATGLHVALRHRIDGRSGMIARRKAESANYDSRMDVAAIEKEQKELIAQLKELRDVLFQRASQRT
jgi:hypothetical protein